MLNIKIFFFLLSYNSFIYLFFKHLFFSFAVDILSVNELMIFMSRLSQQDQNYILSLKHEDVPSKICQTDLSYLRIYYPSAYDFEKLIM